MMEDVVKVHSTLTDLLSKQSLSIISVSHTEDVSIPLLVSNNGLKGKTFCV